MNFIDYLSEKDNKYNLLKLYENKKIDENETTLRFNYKSGVFSDEDRLIISKLANDFFENKKEKYVVKLKHYYMDEEVLCNMAFDYIVQNYANLLNFLEKSQILIKNFEGTYFITMPFPSAQFDYLKRKNFELELEQYFQNIIFDNVVVELKSTNENMKEDLDYLQQIQVDKIRAIYSNDKPKNDLKLNAIFEHDALIGMVADEIAVQIGSLNSPSENITVVGKILYINNLKFTPKNQKPIGDGEIVQQKDYFTFQLNDGSGSIRCVYFPKKDDVEKGKTLKDGDKIAVNGVLEFNNGNYNMKVKAISFCNFEPEKTNEKVIEEFKEVNEKYILVKPQPYQDFTQGNLFDAFETPMTEYFKNTDFVVFDLETTGIDFMTNEVTEIGAVKIHNGKITESFTTLIKPDKVIEEDTIKLNGITNELVANAPRINQVIPDFYKFCDNAVIVAYNIDFDYKFLDKASTKIGYKFKNKQIDALYLARLYVPGLKNFKLKSVVDKLNITLDNAHRALFDTVATAKLLIKLADKIN